MNRETMKILKMVEDGKITPEEAEKLLVALKNKKTDNSGKFYVPTPHKPQIPKEFWDKIETIPSQIAETLNVTFGSMGKNKGRQVLQSIKKARVKVVSGNLKLEGGEGDMIIDGTAWPMKIQSDEEQADVAIVNGNISVEIPSGIEGYFSVVNGLITAEAVEGNIKLDQINGDVEIENCSGTWQVKTISGNVDLENISGTWDIKSRHSNIYSNIGGDGFYNIDTENGDIQIEYPLDSQVLVIVRHGWDSLEIPQDFEPGEGEGESKVFSRAGTGPKIELKISNINGNTIIEEQ